MNTLSAQEQAMLTQCREETEANLDYYEKIALTAEQLGALNEARMGFHKANQANKKAMQTLGLNYA